MVIDAIFYLLSLLILTGAVMVVSSRNPVHSVLFLVMTFFSAAGLFVLLRAEFLAMLLIIVYMGAVAILFLFVVMMLDIDFKTLKQGFLKHLPLGVAVLLVVFAELTIVMTGIHLEGVEDVALSESNTLTLGQVMFTKFLFPFEVVSLILLVALIGAVVLSLRERKDVRRQSIPKQLARRREEAVVLKKVSVGEGARQ